MMKYKQRSEKEWKELLDLYYQEGLSAANFCKKHEIERNTFFRKKKEYAQEETTMKSIEFIEVVPEKKEVKPILLRKNGFQIEVTEAMDKQLLKELVGILSDI